MSTQASPVVAQNSQFSDFGLSAETLASLNDMGFTQPSPIQSQALPALLSGTCDFLGLAGTGTGKTAAFAIPLIESLKNSSDFSGVQSLILCPTRELALQVSGQISLIGKRKRVEALPIYGGAGYRDQLHGLKRGAPIVVGTPGRVIDHLERGTLKLSDLSTLVLDEADEMISMGFRDELEQILSSIDLNKTRIWLFSATMSPQVRAVASKYLRSPQQVQVNRTEIVSSAIEQSYFVTQESNKSEVLCKLIDVSPNFYGIIFCQTKTQVTTLTQYLSGRGYGVDCLHGDLNQAARERAMQGFRDRQVRVLVCTDVAARGLDVKDVTHVVNYSLPHDQDTYVHRIGRTARSGKTGQAVHLITPSQRGLLKRIAASTKSNINEGKIPTRKEVGLKKLEGALEKFSALNDQEGIKKAKELLSGDWQTVLGQLTPQDIAARFLLMMNPQVFAQINEPEPELSVPAHTGRFEGRSGGRWEKPQGGGHGGSQRHSQGSRGGSSWGSKDGGGSPWRSSSSRGSYGRDQEREGGAASSPHRRRSNEAPFTRNGSLGNGHRPRSDRGYAQGRV